MAPDERRELPISLAAFALGLAIGAALIGLGWYF